MDGLDTLVELLIPEDAEEVGPAVFEGAEDDVITGGTQRTGATQHADWVRTRGRRSKWLMAVSLYRDLVELLRQQEDFTDDEIVRFSCLCDDFFELWIELTGRPGITNYIHFIGAGHLTYFLKEYRNLYRYSQQGW